MTVTQRQAIPGQYFNSHPHEEDDSFSFLHVGCLGYFNSHPHEEDDCSFLYSSTRSFISTHILTKRMTMNDCGSCEKETFQLTSSRRGWLIVLFNYFQLFYFNSHPHEEDDHISFVAFPNLYISTHILTKRMTILLIFIIRGLVFQLTSSRRGWRLPDPLHRVHK